MHREDLLVDDRCDGQTIEAIRKGLPQFDVVSSFAFVIKAVNSIYRGTLVIPAENEEVFWILDLVRKE